MVKFGLQDVLEPHDGEVGYVGEVGHGHGQVVLHTCGQSRPIPDIYSLILKSYLILILLLHWGLGIRIFLSIYVRCCYLGAVTVLDS